MVFQLRSPRWAAYPVEVIRPFTPITRRREDVTIARMLFLVVLLTSIMFFMSIPFSYLALPPTVPSVRRRAILCYNML